MKITNELKKKFILKIAPVLRGVTFDGKNGFFVAFSDSVKNNREYNVFELDMDFLLKEQEHLNEEKLVSFITDQLAAYKKKSHTFPKLTFVKQLGYFALGDDYQAVQSILTGDTDQMDSAGDNSVSVVKNKIAVVTGGAQGFGKGIVCELAASQALVFIADMNIEKAKQLADELNQQYGKIVSIPVEVNITSEVSVENMIYEIIKAAGGIDIFISNAGVLKAGSVKEMELNTFSFVTEVNYVGYFLCAKHASRVMAMQNRVSGEYYSDIIQINSKSGLSGSKKNAAYAGGKFGGIGLTQSFALELVEDNIKVNSICPGNFFEGPLWSDPGNGLFVQYLRTGKVPGAKSIEEVKKFYEEKVPMKRGCRVEDVVKAIYYIIDQKYETGQAIPVTGGQNMLK